MTKQDVRIPRSAHWAALLVVALATLVSTGCTVHARPAAVHVHATRPAGRVVTVAHGHRHTTTCGHYRFERQWYFIAGHAHGRGCGHALVRGVWVLKR